MIMQNFLHSIGEKVMPILKDSNFKESGLLTPSEFVMAGDFLVYKCPTWQWTTGDADCSRSYLPFDKQYLSTRRVPCYKRAVSTVKLEKNILVDSEEWIVTESEYFKGKADADPPTVHNSSDEATKKPDVSPVFHDPAWIDQDPSTLITEAELMEDSMNMDYSRLVRVRTYDLSITYDKYYQVPRLWLFGYDEHGLPLKPIEIFQDISQEHARKTVTMEGHPHLKNLSMATIHPCQHANVMKKMIQRVDFLKAKGKSDHPIRVDQYLILFLKFMASVLPTIEYDYTMEG